MNIHDLTISQLKRAVAIRERIEALNNELRSIFRVSKNSAVASDRLRPRFGLEKVDEKVLQELTLAWHRLDAWKDVPPGLSRL